MIRRMTSIILSGIPHGQSIFYWKQSIKFFIIWIFFIIRKIMKKVMRCNECSCTYLQLNLTNIHLLLYLFQVKKKLCESSRNNTRNSQCSSPVDYILFHMHFSPFLPPESFESKLEALSPLSPKYLSGYLLRIKTFSSVTIGNSLSVLQFNFNVLRYTSELAKYFTQYLRLICHHNFQYVQYLYLST